MVRTCILMLCAALPSTALQAQELNKTAVEGINSAIDLLQASRGCGWDPSHAGQRVTVREVLQQTSMFFRAETALTRLSVEDALAAQSLLLAPSYIEGRAKREVIRCDDSRWKKTWFEEAEIAGRPEPMRPLYLDLPSATDRSRYLQETSASCLKIEADALDDFKSDALSVARAAALMCEQVVDAYSPESHELDYLRPASEKMLTAITTFVLRKRAERKN